MLRQGESVKPAEFLAPRAAGRVFRREAIFVAASAETAFLGLPPVHKADLER